MKNHNPFSLQGKVAVVTGAAAGIGRACAQRLAYSGAAVLITDIDEEGGQQLAAELNNDDCQARFVKHDVTQDKDWQLVVSELKNWHGRWDILVNNAGIFIGGRLENNSVEQLSQIHQVNVQSVFLGLRYAAQTMKPGACFGKGGSVINISSIAGLIGVPGHGIYGATKGSVRSISKHAAVEYARFGYGIRVNSLHPGLIDTAMAQLVFEDFVEVGLTSSKEEATKVLEEQMIPMGRLGTAEDIANAALFLACDASSYVSGAELTVDGAFTAA